MISEMWTLRTGPQGGAAQRDEGRLRNQVSRFWPTQAAHEESGATALQPRSLISGNPGWFS